MLVIMNFFVIQAFLLPTVFLCFWSVASGETCNTFFWTSKICCNDQGIGCFYKTAPYNKFTHLPCCQYWNDLQFRLYQTTGSYTTLKFDHALPSAYKKGKRTVVITHGWVESADITNEKEPLRWVPQIREAFLTKYPEYNLIFLDWRIGASRNIFAASSITRVVGPMVGRMLEKLVAEGETAWADLWLIGFSLGAHVMGQAGMWNNGQVGRITGLDPAGPIFNRSPLEVGLNPSCAKLVDVIHTDSKVGYRSPIGHIDFYPEGVDMIQPSCYEVALNEDGDFDLSFAKDFVHCNHVRAAKVFTAAFNSTLVTSHKCPCLGPYLQYPMPSACTPCGENECPELGPATEDNPVHGIYYLTTNTHPLQCPTT